MLDKFGGQVALVEGYRDAVGVHRHLRNGVADTTIVAAAITCRDDKQTVLDVE